MKNLLTIIFIFISVFVMAQTKLDTLVFNKVNEYRIANGLNKIKWDTAAYKASKYHSNYLESLSAKNNYTVVITGHSEKSKGFEDASNRFVKFNGKVKPINGGVWLGEIVQTNAKNYKDNDSLKLAKLATEIVEDWKQSPEHNKIMLTSGYNFGGVSCKVVTQLVGIKGLTNYKVWSTFVFVDRSKIK